MAITSSNDSTTELVSEFAAPTDTDKQSGIPIAVQSSREGDDAELTSYRERRNARVRSRTLDGASGE